ncbi:MAG TPA: hypothetical protein PLU73_08415 [Bacteroidia bacterium]|jgi:hypothetical protein|nr:hypothetical protein [Bacteroidia bacterium]
MQTTIQFGNPSTLQEWSNFKGKLQQAKKEEISLLKKGGGTESLIYQLTKQMNLGMLK